MQRSKTFDTPFHPVAHCLHLLQSIYGNLCILQIKPLEMSKLFGKGHTLLSKLYEVEDCNTKANLSRTHKAIFGWINLALTFIGWLVRTHLLT